MFADEESLDNYAHDELENLQKKHLISIIFSTSEKYLIK